MKVCIRFTDESCCQQTCSCLRGQLIEIIHGHGGVIWRKPLSLSLILEIEGWDEVFNPRIRGVASCSAFYFWVGAIKLILSSFFLCVTRFLLVLSIYFIFF